jgi:hypothetical protein
MGGWTHCPEVTVLVRVFVGTSIALAAVVAAGQPARAAARAHGPPGVRIWTKAGEAYRPADRVQVFFRTDRDAYVTVLRVGTDGTVRVLFPSKPGDPNRAHAGQTYTVSGVDDRTAFTVDDPPGVGYLFAVASQDRFAYDAFTEDDQWSPEAIAGLSDGPIQADPDSSLRDLVQQILPAGYANYETGLTRYDVGPQADTSSVALAAPRAAEPPVLAAPRASELPAPTAPHSARRSAPAAIAAHQPPVVRIWTNHGEAYQQAEPVQVFFRTERNAYVTILRVDTDGRVRVLFPVKPGDANRARGGETYNIPGVNDRDAFVVDDPPGLGYVFAVASQDRFDYDAFAAGEQWNLETVAGLSDGRIHGDPYTSLQDLVRQIMPEGYTDYDTQLLPYDVEQQRDGSSIASGEEWQTGRAATGTGQRPYAEQRDDNSYNGVAAPFDGGQSDRAAYGAHPLPYGVAQVHAYPRFLCYDCHAYTPYTSWNPYAAWCPQFSLAVYDNPLYSYASYGYPGRYYGGTNVVYARTGLGGRQYLFRPRADQAAPFAVYRNRAGGGILQPPGHGVRGVDVGGVGSVPTPGGRRTIGGGGGHAPGGAADQRRFITASWNQSGRRGGSDVAPGRGDPRGIGTSRQYIGSAQRRQGLVYVNPRTPPRSPPWPSAIGRPDQRDNQRYSPQHSPRQGSGYGASQGARGTRGYGDSQGSHSMRGNGESHGSHGTPGYGKSGGQRSGHETGGGSRGSSSHDSRSASGGERRRR